jgi:hypothetical protein
MVFQTRDSIQFLPKELLLQIADLLPAESLLCLAMVSTWLRRALDYPRLWRQVCRYDWTRWSPKHEIEAKFQDKISVTNWRALVAYRVNADHKVFKLFDSLVHYVFYGKTCATEAQLNSVAISVVPGQCYKELPPFNTVSTMFIPNQDGQFFQSCTLRTYVNDDCSGLITKALRANQLFGKQSITCNSVAGRVTEPESLRLECEAQRN